MHAYLHGHPALATAVKRLEQLNPDEFEVFFEKRTSTQIESKDCKIESLSRSEDVGVSVRMVKDRRIGFSFTTSLEDSAIEHAVKAASEAASLMPEDDFTGFFQFSSAVYPHVDNLDIGGLKTPINHKIQLAQELEAECRKADPRIRGIRSASICETTNEIHLVDSGGEHIQHQSTLYTASVTCRSEADGDQQIGSEFGFSNYLDGLEVNTVGRLAARWATELLGAQSAPTMQCPAILRNSVVAELVEFLSSSFSAEEIDKGRSMLAGKEGQMLFSGQVTLIDDGLLPGGYGTTPFDGEGTPSRVTTLVEEGFIKGALYDRYYSRKLSKEPTGSAHRGIKSPPTIGFSNLFMKAGRRSPESLYSEITQGILITDLMGVHTANPVTGDFSLGASGILIENGKLTTPVRGFAVAGNILNLFRKMTDIANDLKFFGSIGAPSVRVSEISVGGT